MSIRYPLEVTVESQNKKVNDRISGYQIELSIVEKALPIIAKFEGKEITKRIATAIQKEMPEYRVRYVSDYGMYHIEFSPLDHYEKIVSMLIGYQSSNKYSPNIVLMEQINEFNKCYTLNKGRIEQLKKGLPEIRYLVANRNKALSLMSEVLKEAEQYEMSYDFDLEK